MNPYYLPEIGYPFANGGYSSAGSAVSSPAPGPSNVPSAAASSTGYGSAHHTPHPQHAPHSQHAQHAQHSQHAQHAQQHAAYGAAATAPPPAAPPAPIPTSGPLVHPHQDLNSFLESFWARQMDAVERETPDFKTYNLPLARIKKVMKSDEEVKMISAEAPIMFSKACEIFISELTCRAWLVAEGHKRRTLQKSDVAAAIAFSDVFDFLIDIVPRDDGSGGTAAAASADADANQDAEGEDAPAGGAAADDGEGGDAMYREYVRGEDADGFA